MQRLKILHIIKSLGRGGAEMLLPETLKLHNTEKFEFHYIYFLPWKDQMVESIIKAGGKVTRFDVKNNIELLGQYNKVIDYCSKFNIDLIHCHLPWSGFLGRIIYKKTGIPVVYTEHNIQEKYHFATKWINKLTYNYQSLAIGVSADVTNSIKKNITPKITVKTIHNGVNTENFQMDSNTRIAVRERLNISPDAVVIGNIAVFRKQKNITVWIKAFKQISEKNKKVLGLLVGAGPEEMNIKSLIKEEGLTERIILPGLQEDTIPYYSAMDIFMMSSDFEGLPIALLEAMSMNCAIISTSAGGVVEVIRDKKDGFLVKVGDWEEMAQIANSLLIDKEKRYLFQTKSRKRVQDSFSLSNMVEELENVYSSQITAAANIKI